MAEPVPDTAALKLEWRAAQLLLALGLVVTIAGFFVPLPIRVANPGGPGAQAPAASAEARTPEEAGRALCAASIATAKAYGVVPAATQPASMPQKTDVTGRYVCEAENGSAKYTVAIELLCTDLARSSCISLFNVTQSDGTVLFQRQG